VKRWVVLAFGLLCYLVTVAVGAYAVFLFSGLIAPAATHPNGIDPGSVGIDLALVALFGLQHSVMARGWFKHWWTALVTEPLERSVYVLASDAALALLCWLWQPIPGDIWDVSDSLASAAILVVSALGVGVAAISNLQIDHFELLGLRQVWAYFRGQPYQGIPFRTPGLYRYVRHPMTLGFLIALWATPHLSLDRFVLNAGLTAYVLLALPWEERDLLQTFGAAYQAYRLRVPRLFPWKGRAI